MDMLVSPSSVTQGIIWPVTAHMMLHACMLPSTAMAVAVCSVLHGLWAGWLSNMLHLPAVPSPVVRRCVLHVSPSAISTMQAAWMYMP